MQLSIPISHSAMFGTNDLIPQEYLSNINRSDLIRIALTIVYRSESEMQFKEFCEFFFSKSNDSFVQRIYIQYLGVIENSVDSEGFITPQYIVASLHTGLELLRIVFSLPVVEKIVMSNEELEQNVFHAILSINEYLIRQEDFKIEEELTYEVGMSYVTLATVLPYGEFFNNDIGRLMISQMYKFKSLLRFCSITPPYDNLLATYLSEIGCSSSTEYLFTLLKMFIITHKAQNPNWFTTIVLDPTDLNYPKDVNILTNISIENDRIILLDENTDYRVFRDKPIIQIHTNNFILINQTLCIHKIYNSCIFNFKRINESLLRDCRIRDVFQDFSSRFSEEFLFYNVMATIFQNNRYIILSGKDCLRKNNGHQGEPDYYVRNCNNILLFEYKDPLFNADTKTSLDLDEIKEYIEDKLVAKRKNEHRKTDKMSAVEQLVNNINRIISGNFIWDEDIIANKVAIYPILVVGNPIFTTVGMTCILNYYFKNKLHQLDVDYSRVRDLVIIDIDTLILFQHDFRDKNLNFYAVLKNYYSYLKTTIPYKKSAEAVMRNTFHYMFSLSTYIAEKYKMPSAGYLVNEFKKDCKEAGIG